MCALLRPRTACPNLAFLILAGILFAEPSNGVAEDSRSGTSDEGAGNEGMQLILGTQRGLLPQELRVFLASLRSTGCQARVVIFSAGDPGDDLAALAHTFEAELLQYNYTDLSTTHGPMNMHRFELYRRFLAARGRGDYAQVLLCDVRDVFFQEDPFATLSVQAGIAVAIEPTRLLIGQCGIHAGWLSTGCPAYQAEGTLERVAGERRSCAGTTIGRHGGVLSYIEAMQREAERTVTRVTHASAAAWEGQSTTKDGEAWRLWCNDQGMHNALLWTGQFGVPGGSTVALLDPEASGLATVGTMENIYINQDGDVMTGCRRSEEQQASGQDGGCEGGVRAALVHQYDRVKALVDLVAGLYGAAGERFETFQEKHNLAR